MIEAIIGLVAAVAGLIGGYLIREGIHRREHIVIKDTLEQHGAGIEQNATRHNQNDVVVATILAKLDFIVEKVSDTNSRLAIHTKEDASG